MQQCLYLKNLYESVATGKESQRSIDSNSKADYREKLEAELKELRESEMWQAGKTVRSLRPENQKTSRSYCLKAIGSKQRSKQAKELKGTCQLSIAIRLLKLATGSH